MLVSVTELSLNQLNTVSELKMYFLIPLTLNCVSQT